MSTLLYYGGTIQEQAQMPVMATLCETMNVDLVVNPHNDVWIIHDKPFPIGLIWAEYDVDAATLSLIGRDGRIIGLGMEIFPDTRKFLRKAQQVFTLRMKDGQVDDSYALPLLVRETGNYKA